MTISHAALPAHSIPSQDAGPRLDLLTLAEGHDLLRLLQLVAGEGDELAEEARWFAQQLSERLPAED
ncbi:hypothetical protein [Streptomyces sp. NPDC051561]|uniref:hypothetical protein n=1 Tax=Streptomyces sp. NPDC051561 TaxID=3365658 RepID=UPI00378E6824